MQAWKPPSLHEPFNYLAFCRSVEPLRLFVKIQKYITFVEHT